MAATKLDMVAQGDVAASTLDMATQEDVAAPKLGIVAMMWLLKEMWLLLS